MHRVPAGKHGTTARNLTDYGDVNCAVNVFSEKKEISGNKSQKREKERKRDDKFIDQYLITTKFKIQSDRF